MSPADSHTSPASTWRLRTRELVFTGRPLVMGILNVTPDSFSDGGRYCDAERAVEQALAMEAQGADLIDIGGESTRPYSEAVAAEEELARVLPVIEALCGKLQVPISIDTSKSLVARAAILAGAEIINDVTGLEGDAAMADVACEFQPGICAMHMRGTPQTMQDDPRYEDVVVEIRDYLAARRDDLLSKGIERERVCLDPGIGFGKKHEHNLELFRRVGEFHELGCPLLVGHSRKGFIGKQLGHAPLEPDAATLAVSLAMAQQGVQVLRVHNVAACVEGLLLFEAVGGLDTAASKTH